MNLNPSMHCSQIFRLTLVFASKLYSDHLNILRAESVEQELCQKMTIVEKLKVSPFVCCRSVKLLLSGFLDGSHFLLAVSWSQNMPIAVETDAANDQHYEVPAKFYDLCLGPCKKYSSGLWPSPKTTFEESEIAMLDRYCELAGVQDGMVRSAAF
jgi:hypothetical protein